MTKQEEEDDEKGHTSPWLRNDNYNDETRAMPIF